GTHRDRRRGSLQVRHGEARRLSVGQPRQRVAAGAHPFFPVRLRVSVAPGDANVFPGRSAVRVRPDLQLGHRREGARPHGVVVRPREYGAQLGARLPLRHRAAWAQPDPDGALRMAGITPSQTVGPYFHYGLTPRDYDFSEVFSNNLVTS